MNQIVGELVAMVGGNASKKSTFQQSTSRSTAQKTHELVSKHHGLSKSDHVFHSIAGGTTQKATARVAAEKTIPMNENSSDDLKEFNS